MDNTSPRRPEYSEDMDELPTRAVAIAYAARVIELLPPDRPGPPRESTTEYSRWLVEQHEEWLSDLAARNVERVAP